MELTMFHRNAPSSLVTIHQYCRHWTNRRPSDRRVLGVATCTALGRIWQYLHRCRPRLWRPGRQHAKPWPDSGRDSRSPYFEASKIAVPVDSVFALTVVLAIFGLVIAVIFRGLPESVLAVWVSLPIAILMGIMMRRGSQNLLGMSILALLLIYFAIYFGAYHLPIGVPEFTLGSITFNPVMTWTIVLLIYCAIASILPVWLLLQPRDYVNSHQLFVALGLLVLGLVIACLTDKRISFPQRQELRKSCR